MDRWIRFMVGRIGRVRTLAKKKERKLQLTRTESFRLSRHGQSPADPADLRPAEDS